MVLALGEMCNKLGPNVISCWVLERFPLHVVQENRQRACFHTCVMLIIQCCYPFH